MAIRLNPDLSDPESDLETQLLAIGALVAGNLMSGALLLNKLHRQMHPDDDRPLPPLYDLLPRASILLFLGCRCIFWPCPGGMCGRAPTVCPCGWCSVPMCCPPPPPD